MSRFRPGDYVLVLHSASVLYRSNIHKVAVVVNEGVDYHGKAVTNGLILDPSVGNKDASGYPYVWDQDRFELVKP